MSMPHTESIGPQYNWPVHLEMLYAFERQDLLPPMPSLAFEQEITRVLDGPTITCGAWRCAFARSRRRKGEIPMRMSWVFFDPASPSCCSPETRWSSPRPGPRWRACRLPGKTGPPRATTPHGMGGVERLRAGFLPDDLVPLLRSGHPGGPDPGGRI